MTASQTKVIETIKAAGWVVSKCETMPRGGVFVRADKPAPNIFLEVMLVGTIGKCGGLAMTEYRFMGKSTVTKGWQLRNTLASYGSLE